MGLFEQLPYTNFSNINLTEIIRAIKQLEKEMHDFTIVNKIEYMGAWNITTQYPSWSVVVVNGTTGYISIQPVPVGINYTNTNYWRLIADFSIELANLGTRVTNLENELSHLIDEISTASWLDNKNVVWYGDSWGTTSGNIISHFTSNFPNVNVTNRCIGGTALSRMTHAGYENNSGYQRITTEDLSGFDYIFIMYGVNDWLLSKTMRTTSPDEYEYIYCVENVITYLKNNYPNLKPVFILESYCHIPSYGDNDVNNVCCTLQAYINNTIDVCDRYNIPYINLYELVGVNRYNYTHYMNNDGGIFVHPISALFDYMSLLVYRGVFNTGKIYGDNWSRNIIDCVIPEYTPTLTEHQTTISGVENYPMRKITTSDSHSLVFVDSKYETITVHISGYKNNNNVLGVSYDSHNIGESNRRTFIANVSNEGYFDMYLEIPRKDMFAPAFLTDGSDYILNGVNCSICCGDDIVTSEYREPYSGHANITITHSFYPSVINGEIHNKYIRFSCSSAISSGTPIIKGIAKTFTNQPVYITGYNQNDLSPAHFYLYNGDIRNETPLVNGKTYIIPDFATRTPV